MTRKLRDDLITSSVGDEIVVFDPRTHHAHCLNGVAAQAFLDAKAGDATSDQASLYAWQLFEDLGFFETESSATLSTRREALSFLGKAAILPVIASLAIPAAAAAQSGTVSEADCHQGKGCGLICDGEGTFGTRHCGADPESGECGCFPTSVVLGCPCAAVKN